jgi:hypothetical protein
MPARSPGTQQGSVVQLYEGYDGASLDGGIEWVLRCPLQDDVERQLPMQLQLLSLCAARALAPGSWPACRARSDRPAFRLLFPTSAWARRTAPDRVPSFGCPDVGARDGRSDTCAHLRIRQLGHFALEHAGQER